MHIHNTNRRIIHNYCTWNARVGLHALNKALNKDSRAKHLDTFDFATLYTNLPHDSLKCNLEVPMNEVFNV